MKTDAQIKRDVQDELIWEPSIDETKIGVSVEDGVVTLSGEVDSYAKKIAAEKADQPPPKKDKLRHITPQLVTMVKRSNELVRRSVQTYSCLKETRSLSSSPSIGQTRLEI